MGNLHLVTGYAGQAHITAADDGSFNTAIFGTGEYVLDVGNKLAASVVSNNKITIADGDLLMQGRHVRLNEGTTVDLTINNGTQDKLRNDLIVARYTKDAVSGVEEVSLVVIQGTAVDSNPSDPAYTSGDLINDHDLLNDMPLYRVPLNGLNIGTLVPLFSIAEVVKDGAITTDKLSNGFVLPMNKGGTASTKLADAPANAIIRKLASSDQLWYTATKKGAFYAKEENGAPAFGTLPLSLGGTGQTFSSLPPYAVIRATSDMGEYPYLHYQATKDGAFYATKENGQPKFGTLPIAQGGTGATTAAAALAALGAFSMKQIWTNASPSSSFAAQTLTITGLSNYNVFIIVCERNTSTSYQSSVVMYVPSTDETYGCINEASVSSSGTAAVRQRNVFITRSANTVEFSTGWMTGSASGNTDVLIPRYILGAKI